MKISLDDKVLSLSNSEDGREVIAHVRTVRDLLSDEVENDEDDDFLTAGDLPRKSVMWDFANDGPTGRLVVPLSALLSLEDLKSARKAKAKGVKK